MEDLRAMREARYEARARPPGPPRVGVRTPSPASAAPAAPAAPVAPAAEPTAATDGRCGHRAISGRTCTRDLGHAEKSHRYA